MDVFMMLFGLKCCLFRGPISCVFWVRVYFVHYRECHTLLGVLIGILKTSITIILLTCGILELASPTAFHFGFVQVGLHTHCWAGRQVWIFHVMAGPNNASAVWAAQRVPDDEVAVIANGLMIREMDLEDTDNFMASPNVLTAAIEAGFWDPEGGKPFDFTAAYVCCKLSLCAALACMGVGCLFRCDAGRERRGRENSLQGRPTFSANYHSSF